MYLFLTDPPASLSRRTPAGRAALKEYTNYLNSNDPHAREPQTHIHDIRAWLETVRTWLATPQAVTRLRCGERASAVLQPGIIQAFAQSGHARHVNLAQRRANARRAAAAAV